MMADLPVRYLGSGWDNELFRLGDSLLVRLPRRAAAAAMIENEIRWLPTLAAHVSADVPVPVFAGHPSEAFPWAWSVVGWIPGRCAADVPVDGRRAAAEALADFLLTLHTPAPHDAPANPYRGLSLDQERLDQRARALIADRPDADALLARWTAWSTAPEWDLPDLWVHGDLHPRNLLLDDRGGLRGVLDWGDVTVGDPACDLATAWLTFDAEGRRAFVAHIDAGGLYDRAVWARARAWALHLGLVFASQSDDEPALRAVGEHALAELLREAAD